MKTMNRSMFLVIFTGLMLAGSSMNASGDKEKTKTAGHYFKKSIKCAFATFVCGVGANLFLKQSVNEINEFESLKNGKGSFIGQSNHRARIKSGDPEYPADVYCAVFLPAIPGFAFAAGTIGFGLATIWNFSQAIYNL